VDTRLDSANAVKCSLAAEALRSFGLLCFPATGWSMLPTVRPGDTLVVERMSPDRVRVRDVVVTGRDGKLCGHRVVAITQDSGDLRWVTQGDALPSPDRPVAESELLGRVAYIIRGGKCLPVPTELKMVQRLLAGIVQRSFPAARVLVFLHNKIQPQKQSTLPCQS
jgi:signal peptidase I